MHKKIALPQSTAELLKECRVSAFRASGSGGQHVNVTDSAVRLIHLPTGITVTSQKGRSQYLNKQECIEKLRKKVEKLNYRRPVRVPTRMSKTAKSKILDTKAKHSKKKQLRSRPPSDDASH